MFNLEPFFFGALPDYFYHQDSNKDINGQGFLERFSKALKQEMESYLSSISNLSYLNDPDNVPETYIPFLSSFWGNPPKIAEVIPPFRKVLKNIVNLYQIKGTEDGVVKYFALWGIEAQVIFHEESFVYDDGSQYDTDLKYDQACLYCRDYDLYLEDPDGVLFELADEATVAEKTLNIISVMGFILPINARLRTLYYNGISLAELMAYQEMVEGYGGRVIDLGLTYQILQRVYTL